MFQSRLVSSTISLLLVAGSFVAATITVGCDTVPVTGYRQVLTISETEENTLGLTAYKEILEKESISKNERYNELVQHVGQKISAVADRSKFEWEFNVIESDLQNTCCLPAGKIVI